MSSWLFLFSLSLLKTPLCWDVRDGGDVRREREGDKKEREMRKRGRQEREDKRESGKRVRDEIEREDERESSRRQRVARESSGR